MPALEKYTSAVVGEAKLIEKLGNLRPSAGPFGPTEDGLRPPSITLCPFKHNYKGWKQATIEDRRLDDQSYNRWCASANITADFERCIEEGTFGLNDTVIQAQAAGKNVIGPEFWTSDVSLSLLHHAP